MTIEMGEKIRWLYIKQAAEKIVVRPVSIHGSTDLLSHLRAAVDATEERVNYPRLKSEA